MPLVRLLLPIIAALALLVQPVTTWAAAGIQRELKCCCRDPEKCDCHDHDGKGPASPSMRRCNSSQVKLVAPVVLTADVPASEPVVDVARPVIVPAAQPELALEDPHDSAREAAVLAGAVPTAFSRNNENDFSEQFMRSIHARAALAAAFIPLTACSGDDGGGQTVDASAAIDALVVDAAPRQVIMENKALQPGQLVEGLLNGGPTDLAVIHLEAPVAELDWNIHGHAGGSVQTVFEELDKMTVDYVFTPTADTDWWLLLRNSGPADMTVSVRVELYNDMQWSWQ